MGEHTIELIVNDVIEDPETNAVVITVIEPIEMDIHIVPSTITATPHPVFVLRHVVKQDQHLYTPYS